MGRELGSGEVMQMEPPAWDHSAYKKDKSDQSSPCSHKEEVLCRHSQMVAVCKPPRTEPAGTLILDFPTSGSARNKCLGSKPPSLWHFVLTAELTEADCECAPEVSCKLQGRSPRHQEDE